MPMKRTLAVLHGPCQHAAALPADADAGDADAIVGPGPTGGGQHAGGNQNTEQQPPRGSRTLQKIAASGTWKGWIVHFGDT